MSRRSFGAIRLLPSGRYQASHAHPDTGKRVNAPRTFPTRAEAAKWLKATDVDLSRGAWTPPKPKRSEVLFAAYAAQWLDRREPELKPRTIADYRRMMPTLIDVFGTEPLDQITRADVRRWHNGLDPAKPAKRSALYILLKSVLKTAVEDELIDVNPCQIRGAGSRGRRAHQVRPATVPEIHTIVQNMPGRWALMVQLAAWCGLRFGEIAELRRTDIDLGAQVIRVSRAVQWVDGEPTVSTPKTEAGVRTIVIPANILAAVATHLDVYADPAVDGLLFSSVTNTARHVSHGSVSQAFQRARKAAGRPDLRFHDLRHTAASMMAEAGATVNELATWLGHTTAEMALFYCHASEARMRLNAERLGEMGAVADARRAAA